MDVGQAAVARRERSHDVVDTAMVGARDRRRHAEEVAAVVAEGRVIDRAEDDAADGKVAQKTGERSYRYLILASTGAQ